jgi:hypothetical protein
MKNELVGTAKRIAYEDVITVFYSSEAAEVDKFTF